METGSLSYTIENPQPVILVISGLSGAGKDTVINRLKEISEIDFHFVVTCNTRKPREGEVEGKDYHFISREKFLDMVANGEMVEHSVVYDDLKGVPRFEIEEAIQSGKDMILRIDYQGTQKVKAVYPQTVSIFIIPPSAEEWASRLRKRGTDTEESLRIRMENAKDELKSVEKFDYIVVNDKVDRAAMEIVHILQAEHARSLNRKVLVRDYA